MHDAVYRRNAVRAAVTFFILLQKLSNFSTILLEFRCVDLAEFP